MSSKKRTYSKPIKFDDDLGLRLYGPTPSNPKFRLVYLDPFTGQRCQPRRTDKADAFALWDETVEYLTTARLAAPTVPAHPSNGHRSSPTVDDLFAACCADGRTTGVQRATSVPVTDGTSTGCGQCSGQPPCGSGQRRAKGAGRSCARPECRVLLARASRILVPSCAAW
jgi:hypothetical protein